MVTVDWGRVLTHWKLDSVALVGLLLEMAAGLAYLLGIARVHRLGRRRWPADRAVCFLLGSVALLWFCRAASPPTTSCSGYT
jgi:cytochrome c oxidase assembly factor CtaG